MEKNAGRLSDPHTRRYAETAASAFPRRNACLLLRLYSSLASSFVACHASTIASSVSYGRTNARPRSSASGVNPKSVAASTDPSARSSPSRFARRARARAARARRRAASASVSASRAGDSRGGASPDAGAGEDAGGDAPRRSRPGPRVAAAAASFPWRFSS